MARGGQHTLKRHSPPYNTYWPPYCVRVTRILDTRPALEENTCAALPTFCIIDCGTGSTRTRAFGPHRTRGVPAVINFFDPRLRKGAGAPKAADPFVSSAPPYSEQALRPHRQTSLDPDPRRYREAEPVLRRKAEAPRRKATTPIAGTEQGAPRCNPLQTTTRCRWRWCASLGSRGHSVNPSVESAHPL